MQVAGPAPLPSSAADADLERRFGGLRRLYGDAGYARLRAARVAVVGVGGVGSWAAEALARSGVAALTLIDFDQVSVSNINRQIHALDTTVGQAKVDALRTRVALIHPGCTVHAVEAFVEPPTAEAPGNWPGLLPEPVDAVIDACDQVRAKLALAVWARAAGVLLVTVGAAGGKRRAQDVAVGDLAEVSHDPLLAALRHRLRREHAAPRQGRIGVRCVFSREAVVVPQAVCDTAAVAGAVDGSLNCHGYGSVVSVTATFGLVAAGEVLGQLADRAADA